jgi:predicted nucleic acid-binding protein
MSATGGPSDAYPAAPAPRTLFVAEPGPYWLQRPPAVVDCSVLAAVLWGEPGSEEVATWLLGKALHAPHLLVCEIANVARTKARSGCPDTEVMTGLDTFARQRVVLHASDPHAVWQLAQRYQLTAYDAAYLSLASDLNAPLLTLDRRLAEAAARHMGPTG